MEQSIVDNFDSVINEWDMSLPAGKFEQML